MDKRTIIKTLRSVILTGLFLILNSCCTKKYCSDNWFWIEFYNYSPDDLDTIIICRYSKNTNYTVLADSTRQEVYQSNGVDHYSLPLDRIEPDNDYKIYILSLGKVHKISNIVTKKESCNSCFLVIPSDKYIQIKSFQLDTENYSGQKAKIYK